MSLKLNTLFRVSVGRMINGDQMYELLDNSDNVINEGSFGTAYLSSEEGLRQVGYHLLDKFLVHTGRYLMYAVAISNNGSVELKWWYEKEARDTTEQFTWQINRPELWSVYPFEFLIPRSETRPVVIENLVIQEYARFSANRPVNKEHCYGK